MSGEVGEMRSERGWLELGCISEIQRKKTFFFGISLDLHYLCSRLIKKVWILQKGF